MRNHIVDVFGDPGSGGRADRESRTKENPPKEDSTLDVGRGGGSKGKDAQAGSGNLGKRL